MLVPAGRKLVEDAIAHLCVSAGLRARLSKVYQPESERDYPTNISRNPSGIIIGVLIQDVLRVVFLRFFEAIFPSITYAFTTSSNALYYIRRTLFSYVIKSVFTTTSYALYYHTPKPFLIHRALFFSTNHTHYFYIPTRALFLFGNCTRFPMHSRALFSFTYRTRFFFEFIRHRSKPGTRCT